MSQHRNRHYRRRSQRSGYIRRRSNNPFAFNQTRKKYRDDSPMQYERLVQWAVQTWQQDYPDTPFTTIWASTECSNQLAQTGVKAGRKLRGKARYLGFNPIDTEIITPISDYGSRNNRTVLTTSAGALRFQFESTDTDEQFDVLYASTYFDDDIQDMIAIAIIPEGRLDTWAAFEGLCARAVRPRIRRRRDVYIIGGTDAFFNPDVSWDDVILADTLKQDIYGDIEAFFSEGVDIYRKLKLAPFRKLLLAGVPGTGKTMLCAALAKHAIDERRIVVYVSGSDRDGATFEKIQRAFQAVASARYPTLLIVEEIDAYLRGDDKARILNVLDGIESPNNPKGTLMLATTNYPDAIDDRIFKRPGRLDRIFVVPTIQEEALAEKMLRHYMSEQWVDEHQAVVPRLLHQPGAFVREVALHARMLAAHAHKTEVSPDMLEKSVNGLLKQMKMDGDFMRQRRALGWEGSEKKRRRSGFGFDESTDS